MSLVIPDETLKAANLTEQQARVEIACRLYDGELLPLWPAAQFAGLSRVEFENELLKRDLPLIRVDEEYVRHELEYARQFGPKDERR